MQVLCTSRKSPIYVFNLSFVYSYVLLAFFPDSIQLPARFSKFFQLVVSCVLIIILDRSRSRVALWWCTLICNFCAPKKNWIDACMQAKCTHFTRRKKFPLNMEILLSRVIRQMRGWNLPNAKMVPKLASFSSRPVSKLHDELLEMNRCRFDMHVCLSRKLWRFWAIF